MKMPKSFFGIYQKTDILLSKTKRKPPDNRRGTLVIKSNPIPTGQAIHELENTHITVSSTGGRVPSPTSSSSAWGLQLVGSIWLSRPEGLGCKSSIGLKEAEISPWRAHIRFRCPETQSKEVTPQESRTNQLVGFARSPEEAGVGCGSPAAKAGAWQGQWWQRPQGIFIR